MDPSEPTPRPTPDLRPGDRVAVVSPSGPSDPDALAAGVAWLRGRYTIADDPRRAGRDGYLAGGDHDRVGALLEAVRDPSVRAVVAARGGYGAMRVLEGAGAALREALAWDPKLLVGFSDVTALHALWLSVGARAVHGPMVTAVGRGVVSMADREALFAALEGRGLDPWRGLRVVRAGSAVGRAAGGNLALLAALAGTPYAMPLDGAVLFLEDVGERPYRIDRMLTTLRLSGALRGVRAVVLGEFTDCEPGHDGVTAADVLEERLADLGVPVLAGAPFGHGTLQRALVLGERVRVERDGSVVFEREREGA